MLGPHHRLRHLLILLLVIVGILVILPIVAPKPRRGCGTYEMAVVRALANINTAQTQYFSTYGRYATSLTELGPPTAGDAASASDLIPTDLALGTKYGYRFSMLGSPKGYAVNAAPLVYNSTGRRSFFTDESTVIREHLGKEPASANDPEIH